MRLFVFGTLATLVAITAAHAPAPGQTKRSGGAPGLLVSTEWLAKHLDDPSVRIIAIGNEDRYNRGHIPGARSLEHMATLGSGHRLLPPDALAPVFVKAGAADGMRVVQARVYVGSWEDWSRDPSNPIVR